MTHSTERFDWGAVYYRGIALGYDNGYAAYRADMAEKRWLRRGRVNAPRGLRANRSQEPLATPVKALRQLREPEMLSLVCRDTTHYRTWRPKLIRFVELRWRDRLLCRAELPRLGLRRFPSL